ncbi:hypothetical protein V493_00444, partial [Pseudogymnoascus sp. VKM F-4281 (FW-2241)]
YNAWKAGERKSAEASPTPAPIPTNIYKGKEAVDLTSAQKEVKIEEGAVNPPTTKTLSPLKTFKADWCELNDVDPQNMDETDEANFLLRWQLVKLKL